ncbi:hypothetical protein ACJBYS_11770, partial [Streptococcus suis]
TRTPRAQTTTGTIPHPATSTPPIEQYITTAFPATSTTVTFDNLADVTGASGTESGALSESTFTVPPVAAVATGGGGGGP